MNKFILIISTGLFCITAIYSQENKEALQNLVQEFRDFEYKKVIEEASVLLKEKEKFSNPELIEIYRMKGISHYALLDDREARFSFIEILIIDTSYTLDPSFTSPKIISFFSDIRNEYLRSIEGKGGKVVVTKYDTVYVPITYRDTTSEYNLKNALIRSIFIPGTGHLYLNSNLKSWLLTFLSVASIGTGIYYTIDAEKKEKIYLDEEDNISEKYNDYNFSYRMRNLAFISFAAIWIYSQLDLLFFIEKTQPDIYSYLPKVIINPREGIFLNYQLKF